MKNVLIFDAETTGVDPKKDRVIEVGAVLWNVPHRSIVECFSGLFPADENPAEKVNGIPAGLLREVAFTGGDQPTTSRIWSMVQRADAIAAHNAPFDHGFMMETAAGFAEHVPWICTIEDLTWPVDSQSQSLVNIALAHGVAVTSAHRAIHDCLLIARLFEAIPDIGERLAAALQHASLPRGRVVAIVSYEERDQAKENGFHWDGQRREWWRHMVLEETKDLPFRTRTTAN